MQAPGSRQVRQRQRGSMAVAMMLMLLGLITILGIVEVGYLYWAHRDAQKVADLAALSGAQQLPDCGKATAAASDNATSDNKFGGSLATNACGTWTAPVQSGSDGFSTSGTNPNAVKVVATRPVPSIWGLAGALPNVSAEAVAINSQPVAAFSVDSQLLELQNSGTLPGILKLLGLNVDETALVGPDGLANLRVTPSGLLDGLCHVNASLCVDVTSIADVGTMNNVLAGKQVSIGDLLDAMAYLGGQQKLAQAALTALGIIKAQAEAAGGTLIQLGTSSAQRGLFALVDAADAQSALNAQLSAIDLVNVGLEVANSQHFADLQIPIPGVTGHVTLIEPPSIAIGGVGATAYTAQLRVYLHIDTSAIPLLGSVLSLVGTNVDIPINVDVTNGKGVLTSLCDGDAQNPTATIRTTASLLNLCVGKLDDSSVGSTSQSCETNLQSQTLVSILGTPIIAGSAHIQGITGQGDLTLHQGETGSIHANLDLGDTVTSLMDGILNLLLGNALPADGQAPAQPDIGTMVNDLWANSGTFDDSSPAGRKSHIDAVKDLISKPISSQTSALLPALSNLVTGLVNSVGQLLGGVLGAVTGDGCTYPGLLKPNPSVNGCKQIISNALSQTQQVNAQNTASNALLAPLAQVIDLLNPLLNQVGEQVLQPTVTQLLGSDPGRVDVNLQSLQCHGAQLVY
ncbi:TadG family pilus assembly protein [Fulvimonas sp. R45]|uniref:TadG family pilus assembly protein n=1 Tax=Fulvimonas sp. R45 TaxID=3045937 RepID=UPI00265D95BC|nr:TadG family pilus assembly protein [Fulvimonas sp. R45]MDO1528427.1 TadG family pilus assembly protein [Fulvimonas sp. R45]